MADAIDGVSKSKIENLEGSNSFYEMFIQNYISSLFTNNAYANVVAHSFKFVFNNDPEKCLRETSNFEKQIYSECMEKYKTEILASHDKNQLKSSDDIVRILGADSETFDIMRYSEGNILSHQTKHEEEELAQLSMQVDADNEQLRKEYESKVSVIKKLLSDLNEKQKSCASKNHELDNEISEYKNFLLDENAIPDLS